MLGLLLVMLAAAQVHCRTPDPLNCWVCGCPPSPPSLNSEDQDLGGKVVDSSQCTKNCTGPGDHGQSISCLTGACAKWRHEYVKASETIVQRGCAEKNAHYNLAQEGLEMNECYQVTVLGVLTTQCNCDTHLCNSQPKQAINKVTIITMMTMMMVKLLMVIMLLLLLLLFLLLMLLMLLMNI